MCYSILEKLAKKDGFFRGLADIFLFFKGFPPTDSPRQSIYTSRNCKYLSNKTWAQKLKEDKIGFFIYPQYFPPFKK